MKLMVIKQRNGGSILSYGDGNYIDQDQLSDEEQSLLSQYKDGEVLEFVSTQKCCINHVDASEGLTQFCEIQCNHGPVQTLKRPLEVVKSAPEVNNVEQPNPWQEIEREFIEEFCLHSRNNSFIKPSKSDPNEILAFFKSRFGK